MPSATFNNSIAVDASPEAVWDQLQEPSIWRSIGPVQDLWDPSFEDGVLSGFQWSTNIGGVVYNGTGKTVDHERPNRFSLVLDTTEMAGAIAIDLSEADGGSGTVIDASLELSSKGLLSSMLFPVVSRTIGEGLSDQVQDLATRLDA